VVIPVGYEAFQGKRRKSVALLCFMLSSAIIASIMVYIDSYSVETWNSDNNVGPVSVVTIGLEIHSKIDEFREIPGISKAASIRGAYAYLASRSLGLWWQVNTFGIGYDQEFNDTFPTIFTLIDGRFPANASEIAISELTADRLYVETGDQVNYSFESINPYDPSYRPSIVTGIYEHGEDNYANSYYYTRAHVIFHSSHSSSMPFSFIYADVDRSKVVAHNPAGSLNFLNEIDEQIRRLDLIYVRTGSSEYAVINLLSDGIEDYMLYLTSLRAAQVLRSGGVLLLQLAVIYLAINHIWNERDYEISMLVARGASSFRVGLAVNIEIVSMAILSIVPGFVLGVIVSRFAIASEGFFVINYHKMISEPLLISYDCLFYSAIIGVVLPLLVLGIHQIRSVARISTEERTGKVARITKALSFMKGDVVLLVMSIALLIALNIGGKATAKDPFLYSVLSLVPFTLFFGMTSLTLKGLR
jgi:ABC-type antimicrobial peptide transport system permease subunit